MWQKERISNKTDGDEADESNRTKLSLLQNAESNLRRSYSVRKGPGPYPEQVIDPHGVSDPTPYPGLIIEEMMESASNAGEGHHNPGAVVAADGQVRKEKEGIGRLLTWLLS